MTNADPQSATVYLGLGSNLGDREAQILTGLRLLQLDGSVRVSMLSSLYETEPVGWDGGPWYLNAVARVQTSLDPWALLHAMKSVEARIGRQSSERNAPRLLDLDILVYEGRQVKSAGLTLPHPRMLQRAFVLWPLAELAPGLEVQEGLTAEAARAALQSHETIRLWKERAGAVLPV